MKRLITLVFVVFSLTSFSQSKAGDYTLTINFDPSFLNSSRLLVHSAQDSSYIQLTIYKHYKDAGSVFTNEVQLKADDLNLLADFLRTYQFKIKSSTDTTGSHKVFENGDSVLVYSVTSGMDGIIVNGTFNQANALKKFQFWSPKKETANEKLIEILFSILYSSYHDEKSINYFELLEQYFPFGLGLKKISENPLKYKLYGPISSDEAQQLNEFFDSLPTNKKVFIDMSNFFGMGTMFYPVIKKYFEKNNNLYWINPSEAALIDLYKIGIPNTHVLSKKKIIRIEEKNGKENIIYKNY